MLNNYLTLKKDLIPNAAHIVANEFFYDPVITYIFPDEDVKREVLPLIFEDLLELYATIGTTYITTSNIDMTFSLINSTQLDKKFSLYSSLIKLIPNILKTIVSVPFIETSKRIDNVKYSLKNLMDFIKEKDEFIFISSIGIRNHLNKSTLLKNMLQSLINYSHEVKRELLIETNSIDMIKLYEEYGFKLVVDCIIDDTTIHAYLLSYTP